MKDPIKQLLGRQREKPKPLPKPKLVDLSLWQTYDAFDLIERLTELVESSGDSIEVLEIALRDNLPNSISILLLNSIPRIQKKLGINLDEKLEFTSVLDTAKLARQCGLGGKFTKDVEAIWKDAKPEEPIQDKPEPAIEKVELEPVPIQEPIGTNSPVIRTNATSDGRQWKIGGQVVSESKNIPGIGFVGLLTVGSFKFQTRGYSKEIFALNQCRSFAEGVLKMLKTVPR